jgi:hypothetical protein
MSVETDPTRFAGLACRACGYDLRGLPEQICPECGQPFSATEQVARCDDLVSAQVAAFSILAAAASIGLIILWGLDRVHDFRYVGCCRCGGSQESAFWFIGVAMMLLIEIVCHAHNRGAPICSRITRASLIATVTALITCFLLLGEM